MKDDEAKYEALLQDGLKELFESYPYYFSTFVKHELKKLATSEKKYWIQEVVPRFFFFFFFFFFDGFSFYKRYSKPYILWKNLVVNKTGINTVNDDQRNFVFDLMKRCNVGIFIKIYEIKDSDNKRLHEKSKPKALDILLKLKKVQKW